MRSILADSYKGLSVGEMENPVQTRIRSCELMLKLPVKAQLVISQIQITFYTETPPNAPQQLSHLKV